MKNIPSYLLRKHLFVFYSLLSIVVLMLVMPTILFADDWTPITPPNSPDARFGHSMVTLPDGRVLMFGGEGHPQGNLFDDLHAFEASGWDPKHLLLPHPPARRDHQAGCMTK